MASACVSSRVSCRHERQHLCVGSFYLCIRQRLSVDVDTINAPKKRIIVRRRDEGGCTNCKYTRQNIQIWCTYCFYKLAVLVYTIIPVVGVNRRQCTCIHYLWYFVYLL